MKSIWVSHVENKFDIKWWEPFNLLRRACVGEWVLENVFEKDYF